MTLHNPCIECGQPTENTRCDRCKPEYVSRGPKDGSPRKIGYGTSWDKLSKRARRMQPFCSDCGTPEDLTCDHSPQAWERYESGLPIRLQDVDVVCRRCNTDRGAARGPNLGPGHRNPGGMTQPQGGGSRGGEAKFESHTPGGYILGACAPRGATFSAPEGDGLGVTN